MRGFEEKRKNICRRIYTEKQMNNYLNARFPKAVTKCGMTASQIVSRWGISKAKAYGLTRRYGIRVINRLVIPYEVTQTPEFNAAISVLVRKQRRKDE